MVRDPMILRVFSKICCHFYLEVGPFLPVVPVEKKFSRKCQYTILLKPSMLLRMNVSCCWISWEPSAFPHCSWQCLSLQGCSAEPNALVQVLHTSWASQLPSISALGLRQNKELRGKTDGPSLRGYLYSSAALEVWYMEACQEIQLKPCNLKNLCQTQDIFTR